MAINSTLDFDFASAAQPIKRTGILPGGPEGFGILVFSDALGVRVSFGGLEVDFDTAAEADLWIERARTDAYRLRIDFLGKRPVRWALEEILSGEEVREVMVSGRPIPFWHRKAHRIAYRRNAPALQPAG